MTERLIWRPNSISPEEWNALSRDEQIKWWQDQEDKRPKLPKPHMLKACVGYDDGSITQTEFCTQVAKLACPEEVEEFVANCPADLMTMLREYLATYGPDESQWPRTFYLATYTPWADPQKIEESRRQEQQRIWDGVRLLKEHLK